MKRALISLTVLLTQLMPPAFARIPALNVEAICKARLADARTSQSAPDQSMADCVHDEDAAKEQLSSLWAASSVQLRNQCTSEARSLGTTSYLDLVSCLEITGEMKSDFQKKTEKQ